jgi:hypothetical protein
LRMRCGKCGNVISLNKENRHDPTFFQPESRQET